MDDATKSVTADERGETAITSAQRHIDSASPAVRVPRQSVPRRPRGVGGAVGGALALLFALAASMLAVPSTAQAQVLVSNLNQHGERRR